MCARRRVVRVARVSLCRNKAMANSTLAVAQLRLRAHPIDVLEHFGDDDKSGRVPAGLVERRIARIVEGA